jgi:hypothetical protein
MRRRLIDGRRPAVLGFVAGLAAILEAGRLMRDKPLKPDRSFSPGKQPSLQPPFTSDQSVSSLSDLLSRTSERIQANLLLRLSIGGTPVALSHALHVIVHAIGKGYGNTFDS